MSSRSVVSTALLTLAALVLKSGLAQSPAPPPMFSPWYAEALRDVLGLEESDAARLEHDLGRNPEDFQARIKLMAYHQRADRAALPQDRAQRFQLALWLITHHPDSEILHSPLSRFSPTELAQGDLLKARALWDTASRAQLGNAAVQWNAASFFESLDPGLHMRYLEATAAADPNHPYALRPLAHLYALTILEARPLASHALAGLNASTNVWVLGNAAYMFQSQYNRSQQTGAPNPQARELAERYFLRAKAIDPNLNRRAILPELEPQQRIARVQITPRAIRLNPVEQFTDLPPTIATVLKARNCKIPRLNAIQGDFFGMGKTGWAVLCAANHSTTLLAFRNDHDKNPDSLTASAGDGDSHEISAVGRDFIVRHYRAYGGPEPPPIDHQGIDDSFLEKASVTWYFYKGRWLQLQGAD